MLIESLVSSYVSILHYDVLSYQIYAMMFSLFLCCMHEGAMLRAYGNMIANVHGYGYSLCNHYKILSYDFILKL